MKLGEGYVGDFGCDTTNVHRRDELQIFPRALVYDAPGWTTINSHREVLLDRQKFSHVGLTIGDHLVTIHRRRGIISNVIRDSDASIEQFDGYVLAVLTVIE